MSAAMKDVSLLSLVLIFIVAGVLCGSTSAGGTSGASLLQYRHSPRISSNTTHVTELTDGSPVRGRVGDGMSYVFNSTKGCDYLLALQLTTLDNSSSIQLHVRTATTYLGTVAVPSMFDIKRLSDAQPSASAASQRLFCQDCSSGHEQSFFMLDVLGSYDAKYELLARLEKHELIEGEKMLDATVYQDGLHFWFFDVDKDDVDVAPLQVSVHDETEGKVAEAVLAATHSSCPVLGGDAASSFSTPPGITHLRFQKQATLTIARRGPALKSGRWYFVVLSDSYKNFTIKAEYGMKYSTYWQVDFTSLFLFTFVCLCVLMSTFLWLRYCQPPGEGKRVPIAEEENTEQSSLRGSDRGVSMSGSVVDEQGFPYFDLEDDDEEPMREVDLSKLEQNCLQYVWQYKMHMQMTALIGIFFGIPMIQTIVAISRDETEGNRDVCYFNERCMRPDTFLSGADTFQMMAWNNIFSNVGYVIAGLSMCFYLMCVQVWRRGRTSTKLIPREFSFIWALSFGLIGEGVFSAMYHMCPTQTVFQVDTVFMFVIAGLFFLELFRKRFGWVWPAWRSAAAVAALLMLNFLGTVADQAVSDFYRYTFESLVIACVSLALLASATFTGVRIWRRERHRQEYTVFWGLISISLALCLTFSVLWIAGLSSSDYILFSVVSSLVLIPFSTHVGFKLYAYFSGTSRHTSMVAYVGQAVLFSLGCICLLASLFFFLGLGGVPTTTNKLESPAASRNLNSDCIVLDYYDAHDIWHFLSALGLMFIFLWMFHGDFREDPKKDHDMSYRNYLLHQASFRPIH
eukprot:TRINITY_DN25701_c0_g1_i1.p1 TRINITY_DN25701_c0_g1~~TRINITY_DN25701_c0_g1_i1.p1  ORF type:complete len:797 (+),score=199.82 TRINITY_DN25701_c0_g1_i1:122-2512(+)